MNPFANANSITAADMNNCLRGLYQDNTNHAVTGTTDQPADGWTMATVSITGGTITATGSLHIIASGTVTNVGNAAKTIKIYFGATAIATVSRTVANAQDWVIDAWGLNTAAATQRWVVRFTTADSVTESIDYTTSAIDTAAAVTCKVTGTLVGATDTITQTTFQIFVVQVT